MKVEWRIDGIYKADAQKVADEIGNDKNAKDRMCNYKNLSPKEYGMILQRSRKRKRK